MKHYFGIKDNFTNNFVRFDEGKILVFEFESQAEKYRINNNMKRERFEIRTLETILRGKWQPKNVQSVEE